MRSSNKLQSQKGATSVEYALLMSLVAIALISAVTSLSFNGAKVFEGTSKYMGGGTVKI